MVHGPPGLVIFSLVLVEVEMMIVVSVVVRGWGGGVGSDDKKGGINSGISGSWPPRTRRTLSCPGDSSGDGDINSVSDNAGVSGNEEGVGGRVAGMVLVIVMEITRKGERGCGRTSSGGLVTPLPGQNNISPKAAADVSRWCVHIHLIAGVAVVVVVDLVG